MIMEQPTLQAKFVFDREGRVDTTKQGHYKIEISVKNAPEDAYAVTYRLHPSYFDPIREAMNKEDSFMEEITSYGDYLITARVRTKSFPVVVQRSLYEALAESHNHNLNSNVSRALEDIKNN